MEITEIKSQLTLAHVLQYYGLKPDKNLRLHCPFHEDTIPSTGFILCQTTATLTFWLRFENLFIAAPCLPKQMPLRAEYRAYVPFALRTLKENNVPGMQFNIHFLCDP